MAPNPFFSKSSPNLLLNLDFLVSRQHMQVKYELEAISENPV